MPQTVPSEEEVLRYFEKYSNWGRWGKDDQAGTLNHITPEKRLQSAGLIKDGTTVSCARMLTTELSADTLPPMHPQPTHFMIQNGEQFADVPNQPGVLQAAMDYFGICFHNPLITHLDSIGHVFWDGKMYNGVSAAEVTSGQGAKVQSVDVAKEAVITKGVLLDLPRLKGVKWLGTDQNIHGEDLEEAEKAQGVRVEPGDVLLVRTGYLRRRNEEGPWNLFQEAKHGGMHATCIPFLHDRGVAVLGRDGSDARTPEYKTVFSAIHQVGIVAMGLWLIDYCNLEELATACEERGRWEFMFTMGPLRIQYATGSPVNPIAVL